MFQMIFAPETGIDEQPRREAESGSRHGITDKALIEFAEQWTEEGVGDGYTDVIAAGYAELHRFRDDETCMIVRLIIPYGCLIVVRL